MKNCSYLGVLLLTLLFSSCNKLSHNNKVNIIRYKLVYDSLYNKFNKFDIQLYTTLQFNENQLERKDYNDFFIIIKNDTFPLIPEINNLRIKNEKGIIEIDYNSRINFSSKTYKNDSITNIIKDSYIINSQGNKITKGKKFTLESLITLSYKESDIRIPDRSEMKKNNIKQ